MGDGEFRAVASVMPGLRKVFPRMLYPPEALDVGVGLGVRRE